ncbi:MAG TPA: methyltransferase domain-containing protein [Sphingomicrobium sp.]|nr:methyltransferase domain-containing protein [Sphingomicrobium sp.]
MVSGVAVSFYNRRAAALIPAYGSVLFEQVHAAALPYLPALPARVLDVGAGSGRDAAALSALGFEVTAVEPASELRKAGKLLAPHARWLADKLPRLAILTERDDRFAFILCSAVLMSLKPRDLAPSLAAMARLLLPYGVLAVTLRDPSASEAGSGLHRHSDDEVRGAATLAGLSLLGFAEVPDSLGREHRWRSYVFAAPDPKNR